jgi:hypothetical protein
MAELAEQEPPTCEEIMAWHAALWRELRGIGDPPPLIVSEEFYQHAIAVGFPAEHMRIAVHFPTEPGWLRRLLAWLTH